VTFADLPADVARDRWGRPLVIPPEGGKTVPYTRCTTYVGVLEDTCNLAQWQKRMVAIGLAQRPDLLLRVSSLGRQPADDDPGIKRWKDQMNDTCEAATEAASASASATIGTAIHALTERLDRGQDVGAVPADYMPHLRAYEAATSNFTAVHIERFTVQDDLKIGGTPDRVLQIDGHDKLIIGDIKTGSVEYGVGKMCMQLAVYAHSQLYNPSNGQRSPLGQAVDLDKGVIIALNAKTGDCNLLWVDLAAGWRAVHLATQVREWRAKKNLSKPYDGPTRLPLNPTLAQEQARDLTVEAAVALEAGIRNAKTYDELVQLWTVAGTAWQPHHTELAARRQAELQQRHLTVVS
jgi:hypothetical protein